jgi:hypothetical protein
MISVQQPNYQQGYSDIGKTIGGFISSIPDEMKAEEQYKFKTQREKEEWQYIQDKMRDEKQFKTTMSNLIDQTMGENYSQEEKDAVKKEIATKDPTSIAASAAEFISAKNYLEQIKQKYPGSALPKPIFGQSLEHYKNMTQIALQGLETKAISGAMGGQPQPLPQAPGANEQFYSDQQIKGERENYGGAPQPIPQQSPQSRAELIQRMAGSGINLAGQQAKEAVSALPTDYQQGMLESKKMAETGKQERAQQLQAHKDAVLEEQKRWHDLQLQLGKARNSIQAGRRDDLTIKNVANLVRTGQSTVANVEGKINSVDDDIARLKKEKVRIKQKISESFDDKIAKQYFQKDLEDIDKEIETYNLQKEQFKILKDEIKRNIDHFQKVMLEPMSEKKGYPYKEEKPNVSGDTRYKSTKTGKRYLLQPVK